MPFETFDLGKVLATAEQIKGLKRQAKTDTLRDAYLNLQTQGAQQSQQFAANQEQRAQQDQQAQMDERTARMYYFQSHAIETAANPIEAAKRLAPELIQKYDQAHGPGSFDLLEASEVKALAGYAKKRAGAIAGIAAYEDSDAAQAQKAQQEFLSKQGQTQFGQARQLAGLEHQYNLGEIGARGVQDRETAALTAPGKQMRSVQQLRKEFRSLPSVKDYETVLPLIKSAENAPDNGYGDLQLIYTAGKILDPGSVVREGELNLAIQAGSPLQRMLGTTRFSLEKGGRLPPTVRKQLVGMLKERVSATEQAYTRDYNQFAQYAGESGLDTGSVVGTRPESAYQGAGGGNGADPLGLRGGR